MSKPTFKGKALTYEGYPFHLVGKAYVSGTQCTTSLSGANLQVGNGGIKFPATGRLEIFLGDRYQSVLSLGCQFEQSGSATLHDKRLVSPCLTSGSAASPYIAGGPTVTVLAFNMSDLTGSLANPAATNPEGFLHVDCWLK